MEKVEEVEGVIGNFNFFNSFNCFDFPGVNLGRGPCSHCAWLESRRPAGGDAGIFGCFVGFGAVGQGEQGL